MADEYYIPPRRSYRQLRPLDTTPAEGIGPAATGTEPIAVTAAGQQKTVGPNQPSRQSVRPRPPLPADIGQAGRERLDPRLAAVPARAAMPLGVREKTEDRKSKMPLLHFFGRANKAEREKQQPSMLVVEDAQQLDRRPPSSSESHSPSTTASTDSFPMRPAIAANFSYSNSNNINPADISTGQTPSARTSRYSPYCDPPPLLKVSKHAIKCSVLWTSTLSADIIVRAHNANIQTSLPYDRSDGQSEHNYHQPSGQRQRQKQKHEVDAVKRTSNMPTAPLKADLTQKLYVLTDSGLMLQYPATGSSDRLPEKILQLGARSAAFASDLIPGQHWVLQLVASVGEDGVATPEHQSSLIARFRQGAASRRATGAFLVVMSSADEMDSWLTASRRQIESLGGRRAQQTLVPTNPRPEMKSGPTDYEKYMRAKKEATSQPQAPARSQTNMQLETQTETQPHSHTHTHAHTQAPAPAQSQPHHGRNRMDSAIAMDVERPSISPSESMGKSECGQSLASVGTAGADCSPKADRPPALMATDSSFTRYEDGSSNFRADGTLLNDRGNRPKQLQETDRLRDPSTLKSHYLSPSVTHQARRSLQTLPTTFEEDRPEMRLHIDVAASKPHRYTCYGSPAPSPLYGSAEQGSVEEPKLLSADGSVSLQASARSPGMSDKFPDIARASPRIRSRPKTEQPPPPPPKDPSTRHSSPSGSTRASSAMSTDRCDTPQSHYRRDESPLRGSPRRYSPASPERKGRLDRAIGPRLPVRVSGSPVALQRHSLAKPISHFNTSHLNSGVSRLRAASSSPHCRYHQSYSQPNPQPFAKQDHSHFTSTSPQHRPQTPSAVLSPSDPPPPYTRLNTTTAIPALDLAPTASKAIETSTEAPKIQSSLADGLGIFSDVALQDIFGELDRLTATMITSPVESTSTQRSHLLGAAIRTDASAACAETFRTSHPITPPPSRGSSVSTSTTPSPPSRAPPPVPQVSRPAMGAAEQGDLRALQVRASKSMPSLAHSIPKPPTTPLPSLPVA